MKSGTSSNAKGTPVKSVREIARSVGVSVATVSRVLNNHRNVDPQTRTKVMKAVSRGGYVRSVGRRLTTVIALAYSGEPVRADYGGFESALLSGMLRGVSELKFDLQIVSLGRDKTQEETYTQYFMRKGIRGVILRTIESTRHICEAIAAEGFPHVVVADRFDDPRVNFVWSDSRDDSRRAVRHLIDLGHRRIALGTHSIPDTDHRERRKGYEEALAEKGLPLDPELIVEVVASMDGGTAIINRLMGLPNPPTAIYLTNPLTTLGAMRRCYELGVHVPQELSIVGFDDSDTRRHMYPTATAVCQDAEMLGFEAAQWLTRMLSEKAEASFRLVRPTMLDINQSTGVAPESAVRLLPTGRRIQVGSTTRGEIVIPGEVLRHPGRAEGGPTSQQGENQQVD